MRRGHRRDRVVRGIEARKRYIVVSFLLTSISRGISSVVERLLSMHEVVGSIPTFSTFFAASIFPRPWPLDLALVAAMIVTKLV